MTAEEPLVAHGRSACGRAAAAATARRGAAKPAPATKRRHGREAGGRNRSVPLPAADGAIRRTLDEPAWRAWPWHPAAGAKTAAQPSRPSSHVPPCFPASSSIGRSSPRVLSIVITLAGGLALFNLPLAQYPPVTPPQVTVNCTYPGASAQVVAETVAAPIEQQVNGVEEMMYMSSQCANDGSYSLTVTFQQGMNLNLAQVLVQNRVNLALPQLPDVLKQTGVTTRKMSPDILMSVNLISPHGRYDQLYLSNFAWMKSATNCCGWRGSATFSSAASAITACGSGSTRRSSPRGASPPTTSSTPCASRTPQMACGQIGQQPALPGQATQVTLDDAGPAGEAGAVRRHHSPQHAGRPRSPASATSARVELGAKNEDVSANWTACRRWA